MMRFRFLALVVGIVAAVGGTVPASASSNHFNPPKRYYLSLGDSVAFGYQRDKLNFEVATHTYSPSNFPGYTYAFGADMRAVRPALTVVDYGCPGETTVSYTLGCFAQDGQGLPLHDSYAGRSQEQAALAFLHAHHSQVSPITVALGANDAMNGVLDSVIQQNLTQILNKLRAAAPNAEIIVLQYYNPYYVVDPRTDARAMALDASIGAAASSVGARVANAFAVINDPNPTPPATEFSDVCFYTLMCVAGVAFDIHPSDAGYTTIAGVFWDASGYARLTS
jgi:lysophospholipase L1-like esterase